jgi:polyisoprenoid-binding protein YceI
MKRMALIMAALSLSGIVFAFLEITPWKVDKDYSIRFSSKDVTGVFEKFNATIVFDESKLQASSINIVIDAASLNTGMDMQTEDAKSHEWFDVKKYPEIRFTSSRIDTSGKAYIATGKMELHGIQKEIGIPFSFERNGDKGVFSSSFIINRNDYKVGLPGYGIAEEIKVEVRVPVVKK